MKLLKKHIQKWNEAWLASNRTVPFSRAVSDAIREEGASAFEIQQFITAAMVTPPADRSPLQKYALKIYNAIKTECFYNLEEDASGVVQGQVFLLKAEHGLEDKSTIKVEGDLKSVIEERSKK